VDAEEKDALLHRRTPRERTIALFALPPRDSLVSFDGRDREEEENVSRTVEPLDASALNAGGFRVPE
jgi:hypothetical protein